MLSITSRALPHLKEAICSARRSTLDPAARDTTSKFCGFSLHISNVWVPMEPCEDYDRKDGCGEKFMKKLMLEIQLLLRTTYLDDICTRYFTPFYVCLKAEWRGNLRS